jgi:ribosomal protein L17
MKRQPHWDQFEVALLVDAYIRITEKGENKKIVLEKLSKQLRDKACNERLEIDDTFRNLNGMMWQIGFVECAFKKTGYGKHMPSKLFQHVVDLYQENRAEYNRILTIAAKKHMVKALRKK